MDRLEKVHTDLYDEYMDQMVERVANQRREIRQRSLEMERKLAEKEEREVSSFLKMPGACRKSS